MTIAWVTGGGTGIGRALADALYREGARVAISGRRREVLENAARDIASQAGGGEIMALPGDITDSQYLQDAVSAIRARWGDIDLLVNNAGVNPYHPLESASLEEYQKTFHINCLAAIACTQAVLPAMLKLGRGAIINVSSVLGKWASSGSAAYSVSKYALAGFTDVLRQGLVGTPVHVLGVYPGFIQTDMTTPFVQPGALKSRFAKKPGEIAVAILKALHKRKTELYYPWYVSWLLRLQRWMPKGSDRLARSVKR